MNNHIIISGSSNIPLAKEISKILGLKLIEVKKEKFKNGEINVEILENIRNKEVFLIQTGHGFGNYNINDILNGDYNYDKCL